jgi:hypothetical protein
MKVFQCYEYLCCVLKRMVAVLTESVSGGGCTKFRFPSLCHHSRTGLSIRANSYERKIISGYTLYETVGETVKSETPCSLVDGSWGGSFTRNVGISLPDERQAQPINSFTAARTSDLTVAYLRISHFTVAYVRISHFTVAYVRISYRQQTSCERQADMRIRECLLSVSGELFHSSFT